MAPSRQQVAIRDALRVLDHPTADEVFFHVRRRLPRVSLATVYRNLDQLVEQDEILAHHVSGTRRYDDRTDQHAHLRCTDCDRLIDVAYDTEHVAPLLQVAATEGFQVSDQVIELRGRCKTCAQTVKTAKDR